MKLIRLKNRKKEPASAYTTTDTVFDARNRTLTSIIDAINKAIDNVKAALSGKANASDLSKKADKTLVIPYNELTYEKVKTAIDSGRDVVVRVDGELYIYSGYTALLDEYYFVSISDGGVYALSIDALNRKPRRTDYTVSSSQIKAWNAKADDSKVVHLTGKEAISGTKTFDTLRAKDFGVLNSEDKGFYVSAVGYDGDETYMIAELNGSDGDEPVVLRNIGTPVAGSDAATKGYVDGTVKAISDKLDAIYEDYATANELL